MKTKNRIPRRIIAMIHSARRSATMEQAAFKRIHEDATVTVNGVQVDIDTFIKERTRLYRETWILPQLDDVMAWAKGEGR